MADLALWVTAMAGALAAAGALVARAPRLRAASMALAFALAPTLILADRWNDARLVDLRDEPALILAAAILGTLAVFAAAAAIRRWPLLFPLLAVAALPFRVPVDAGGDSANLLVPLYFVIAAGVVAELWTAFSGPPKEAAPAPRARALHLLPWALAALLVVYATQGIYSDDFPSAAENLGFFLVPFAVLAALLLRVSWTPSLLRWVFAILIAEAALFAAVGFAQYGLRELFWNQAIIDANELHAYFRVNSLFWDPNILGRYLMVAIVAAAATMLWAQRPGRAVLVGALALALLGGLAITFSQSSLVGLLAGLVTLAALRWSVRWTAFAVGLAALAAVAAIALSGGVDLSDRALENRSSGRAELVRGGLEIAADYPIAGLGSGSFEREYGGRFVAANDQEKAVVSHTEPVTVMAEQGALGFLVYVALLGVAIAALGSRIGAFAPGVRRGAVGLGEGDGRTIGTTRVAALAILVAMIAHSLFYAAFFTDPITWALLAIGVALAAEDPGG